MSIVRSIVVKYNQSLLDLSIQAFGTVEAVIESAFMNDLSVTDELIEGEELELPEFKKVQTEIMNFYTKNKLKPVTALTNEDFVLIETDNCNLCYCFK